MVVNTPGRRFLTLTFPLTPSRSTPAGTQSTGSSCCLANIDWEITQEKAQSGQPTAVKSVKWVNLKRGISSSELLSINSRFCGGY